MGERPKAVCRDFVMKRFRLFALLVFPRGAPLLAGEPESADLRYFRELVETRNYSLGQPVSPQITPDGTAVIFLRGGGRGPRLPLFEVTIRGGKVGEILTPGKNPPGGGGEITGGGKKPRGRGRPSPRGVHSVSLLKEG